MWTVMNELFKKEALAKCFQGFAELLMLKVLESHNDSDKEVRCCLVDCAGGGG